MKGRLLKTGAALMVITVLSKIAAFFVTLVFSYYYGSNSMTDAYYAASTIPNLVNNSLTFCVLSLFVPVYIRCETEVGIKEADSFASTVLTAFAVFNTILAIVVSALSPFLAKVVAPGFSEEQIQNTSRMIRLLSLTFPITVASYTLNNVYNVRQKYILPAFLTLLNHLIIIGLTIFIGSKYGLFSYPFICLAAWTVQLFVLFGCSNNRLFKYKVNVAQNNRYFFEMLKFSIPVMIATAADQINLAADNIISSSLELGSLTALGYAHRIFNSINGLLTATLLTMYYPIISKQYSEKNTDKVLQSIRRYLFILVLISLPVTILLMENSEPIMKLLFLRGAMSVDVVKKIAILFSLYIAGFLFIALKEFVTKLFYVIGSTRIPTVINAMCVCINIILSVILKSLYGVYGIAIATTFAITLCSLLECIALGRRYSILRNHIIQKMIDIKAIGILIIANVSAYFGSKIFLNSLVSNCSDLIKMLLCILIYLSIMFFIIVIGEKKRIRTYLRK